MAFCSDELFEIFSYFPAKAIHRFKCTSNSVAKLLEEPKFALKQALNSLKKDDTCFFLQQETSPIYNEKVEVELHALPGNESSSGVSKDVLLRLMSNSTSILASSKGLILCQATSSNTPAEFFVCNPVTKTWMSIPFSKEAQQKHFGDPTPVLVECSVELNDYMIFQIENPTDWSSSYPCRIYNPRECHLWRTTKTDFFVGGRNMKFSMPVYWNGAVHYISDCSIYMTRESIYFRPYIMSYNLESGTSTMLKLPKDARRVSHDSSCDMSIFGWGKTYTPESSSICLVRLMRSVFTVWILTDYQLNRWLRILKVRTKGMGLREKDPKIIGFSVINGDLLIFATETRVYSYGLAEENYMNIEEICLHSFESNVCFTSYLDTLRPCGPEAASLPFNVVVS